MADWLSTVGELLHQVTSWRVRVCPACKSRALVRLASALWTGIPGTLRCRTYRCRGCAAELFAVDHDPPMTMAEHAVWREAKQLRILEHPVLDSELPKATVRPRGWRGWGR